MAKSKISLLRERLHEFTYGKVWPKGVNGVFVDNKYGQYRIVVLHSSAADTAYLKRLARKYFPEETLKLILQKKLPSTSAGAISGTVVQHEFSNSPGTLGGFLRFEKYGNSRIGVSNSHVLAACGAARPKDRIIDLRGTEVGQLVDFNVLQGAQNELDAGLFLPSTPTRWQPSKPTGIASPQLDWGVWHHGAASAEVRFGTIRNWGNVRVRACGKIVTFKEVMTIESHDDGPFSIAGDSGSFIRTFTGDKLVACLFAGQGRFTYAFPISAIFKHFGPGSL